MGADHLPRMNGFPAPRRLRLALLDDHEVVRRGTALHHGCSNELLCSLQRTPVDVAIIDLTLARDDLGSLELVALLRREFPRTQLLAFATLCPTTNLNSLIDAGLHGFVSKAEPLAALSDAIVRVSQGLTRVPPDVRLAGDRGELSRNEREVLGLLLEGLTVSEIALRRHRSIKTVSTQKVAVLRKLGLRSDVEIYALRERLETP